MYNNGDSVHKEEYNGWFLTVCYWNGYEVGVRKLGFNPEWKGLVYLPNSDYKKWLEIIKKMLVKTEDLCRINNVLDRLKSKYSFIDYDFS